MFPVSVAHRQISMDGSSRLVTIPMHRDYRFDPVSHVELHRLVGNSLQLRSSSASKDSTTSSSPSPSMFAAPLQGSSASFSAFACTTSSDGNNSKNDEERAAAATAEKDDDEDDATLMANPNESSLLNEHDEDEDNETTTKKKKVHAKGAHVAFVFSAAASSADENPSKTKKKTGAATTAASSSWIAVFTAESLAFLWAVEVPTSYVVVPNKLLLVSSHVLFFLAQSSTEGAAELFVAVRPSSKTSAPTAAVATRVDAKGLLFPDPVVAMTPLQPSSTSSSSSSASPTKTAAAVQRVMFLSATGMMGCVSVNVRLGTMENASRMEQVGTKKTPMLFSLETILSTHPSFSSSILAVCDSGRKTMYLAVLEEPQQQQQDKKNAPTTGKKGKTTKQAALSDAAGSVRYVAVNVSSSSASSTAAMVPIGVRPSTDSTFAFLYAAASSSLDRSIQYVTLPLSSLSSKNNSSSLLEQVTEESLIVTPLLALPRRGATAAAAAASSFVCASWFDPVSVEEVLISTKQPTNPTTDEDAVTPWIWISRLSCHYGPPSAKELQETAFQLVTTPAKQQQQQTTTNASSDAEGANVDGEDEGETIAASAQQRFSYVYPMTMHSHDGKADEGNHNDDDMWLWRIRGTPRSHTKLLRQWPHAVAATRALIQRQWLVPAYRCGTWNPALLRTSLRHCTAPELQSLFHEVVDVCRVPDSTVSFARRCTAAVDIASQLVTLHRQLGIALEAKDVAAYCRLLRSLRLVGHRLCRAEVRITAMLRHAGALASRLQRRQLTQQQDERQDATSSAVRTIFSRQQGLSLVGATYTPLPWAARVEAHGAGGVAELEKTKREAESLLATVRWGEGGGQSSASLLDWEALGADLDQTESDTLKCIEEPFVRLSVC